jgi:hypothetical protein
VQEADASENSRIFIIRRRNPEINCISGSFTRLSSSKAAPNCLDVEARKEQTCAAPCIDGQDSREWCWGALRTAVQATGCGKVGREIYLDVIELE